MREALPGWAGGVLTGLQGVLLSYLVVLAPALAAVAGAPSLDGSAAVDWSGAATVATRLWLLGHGVPVPAGDGVVSLVPLGMVLLSGAILASVARRFAVKTWTSWGLAVAAFAGGAGVIAGLATAATDSTTASVLRATTVGALIAAPAVAIGIWRAYGARLETLDRIPATIRAGLRLGLATFALVLLLAAAAGTAWAVLGMDRIASTATGLAMDPLGAGALALGEVLYVPTLACWMVAWVIGPGFVVGTGSLYAPDTLTEAALPQLPLLGALPSGSGGWWVWAPAVVAALAALAFALLHRRVGRGWAGARAAGTAVAVVAAGLAALTMLSRGSIGPGALAVAGAEVVPVTIVGTALVAGGYAAVWGAREGWRWLRSRGNDAGRTDDVGRAGEDAVGQEEVPEGGVRPQRSSRSM